MNPSNLPNEWSKQKHSIQKYIIYYIDMELSLIVQKSNYITHIRQMLSLLLWQLLAIAIVQFKIILL